jgi:uncharacterized protein
MARVDAALRIELAWSPAPRQVTTMTLTLPAGSTLADALALSGINTDGLQCGIWGRAKDSDQVLREGDRIELYRPLQVDPKEARRLRYKKQGRRGKTPPQTGP